MGKLRLLVAVCLLQLGFPLTAVAEALYAQCAVCHGDEGQGKSTLGSPALTGQSASYLSRQLLNFRNGVRGSHQYDAKGAQMKAMAAGLSDADIKALSAYLANLPNTLGSKRGDPAAEVSANLQNGNNQYHAKCGACHGGAALGNDALNSPALAFLDAEYLQRQFENFQTGKRGVHEQDVYGRQMKMMANTLASDKDLTDVIAYIQAQTNAVEK